MKVKKEFKQFTQLPKGALGSVFRCNGCLEELTDLSWMPELTLNNHAEKCMQLHMKQVTFRKNNR